MCIVYIILNYFGICYTKFSQYDFSSGYILILFMYMSYLAFYLKYKIILILYKYSINEFNAI